ncbi:MAG TPA: hypothetical protein VHU15_08355 [Stellaceae bacterium]|jgi:hypothetical protein|nr:hypothetical protein [Stellaceae bacterium]
MDTEFAEISLEQREALDQQPLPEFAAESGSALPAPDRRPRGRPFVKGQSGNPAGRPRRIHPSAAAVDYVIGRRSIRIAHKVRQLLLAGDPTMLRLWYQDVTAARRAEPHGAGMPLAEDRAQLRAMRQDLADAVAKGAITPAQADSFLRIVNTVLGML